MKITTRILSGYGLLIAILVGLAVYQYITITRMRELTETLRGIRFQRVLAGSWARAQLDTIEQYAKKSFVDPDFYAGKLHQAREDFEKSLGDLKTYANSAREQAEVKRLSDKWIAFSNRLDAMQRQLPQGGADLPGVLEENLNQLSFQIDSVIKAGEDSIRSTVDESSSNVETAWHILWSATFAALATSILVSYLILRSISKPLAALTLGTRSIARGKFHFRLDTSRDDEFSQLAKDFNAMTRRLNELDELKKLFVSHVSHELKVPLASMQEIIQLLLDEIPGPLTEKQKGLLELNLRSSLRLTSMINNLLDLSKLEAGVMEYEFRTRDLLPLVHNAVAEIEVQAQERGIQIKTDLPEEPLQVECDSDRVIQVIMNLVGNAVKFSPKAGSVRVKVEEIRGIPTSASKPLHARLSRMDNRSHLALVTVSDSGPGVPDSDKEMVFERFHQVKMNKRMAGQGVGLGLAICHAIVEAHRGAIWVEDNPGGGSWFRMLLQPGRKEAANG